MSAPVRRISKRGRGRGGSGPSRLPKHLGRGREMGVTSDGYHAQTYRPHEGFEAFIVQRRRYIAGTMACYNYNALSTTNAPARARLFGQDEFAWTDDPLGRDVCVPLRQTAAWQEFSQFQPAQIIAASSLFRASLDNESASSTESGLHPACLASKAAHGASDGKRKTKTEEKERVKDTWLRVLTEVSPRPSLWTTHTNDWGARYFLSTHMVQHISPTQRDQEKVRHTFTKLAFDNSKLMGCAREGAVFMIGGGAYAENIQLLYKQDLFAAILETILRDRNYKYSNTKADEIRYEEHFRAGLAKSLREAKPQSVRVLDLDRKGSEHAKLHEDIEAWKTPRYRKFQVQEEFIPQNPVATDAKQDTGGADVTVMRQRPIGIITGLDCAEHQTINALGCADGIVRFVGESGAYIHCCEVESSPLSAVRDMAWSPDATRLAVIHQESPTVRLFAARLDNCYQSRANLVHGTHISQALQTAHALVAKLEHKQSYQPSAADWAPHDVDAGLVVAYEPRVLVRWDLRASPHKHDTIVADAIGGAAHTNVIDGVRWNASGTLLAVRGAGRLAVWDVRATRQPIQLFCADADGLNRQAAASAKSTSVFPHDSFTAMAWNPVRPGLLVAGCASSILYYWDMRSTSSTSAAAYENRPLVRLSRPESVLFHEFSTSSGQKYLRDPDGAVVDLAWHPSGQALASANRTQVRFLRPEIDRDIKLSIISPSSCPSSSSSSSLIQTFSTVDPWQGMRAHENYQQELQQLQFMRAQQSIWLSSSSSTAASPSPQNPLKRKPQAL